jgi:small-conductance mechanosensitive channel
MAKVQFIESRIVTGWRRGFAATLLLACVLLAATARAQEAAPGANPDAAPQIRLFLDLLDDPEVRAWLERQRQEAQAAAPTAAEGAPMMSPHMVSSRIDRIRATLSGLATALPRLPHELERVWAILRLEFQDTGLARVALLIAFFVLLGFIVEWIFRHLTRGMRDWIANLAVGTTGSRLRALLARLTYGIGLVAAFAIGSIGAFLPFRWPPLLRDIVLGYLLAFLALRLALAIGRFLLAPAHRSDPEAGRLRVLPMTDSAAQFWHFRLGLFIGWFAFGYVTVTLLGILGLFPEGRKLVAYLLGLGLLAIGLEATWRRPPPPARQPAASRRIGIGRQAASLLVSAYLVLLWALWVAGAMNAFWLLAILVPLPKALGATRRAVQHVLGEEGAAASPTERQSLYIVSTERGLRAAILVGTALLLAYLLGIDLIALTASDTLWTRLARGALSAVVIILIADFLWRLAKVIIDRKIAEAQTPDRATSEEARRRARLRTLLPIFRNLLAIVLLAMAAMMVLSAIGIEIGPLIAGAGVVGVAIGFGAQTLVKDIISGMFYLLDDAFRVGEYIQSGNYKGTVESFSLRSVKLRHHRGPLYTVPFGELGAVQNMSRDWVIDKLTIGVTYDTDLEKAKKLIKQIGKELAADPEFGPNLLETLKMQGVEQFGDFAIQLRMKMMTRPGEQFVIRRKAYALIKKAFDANGIKFALPTVHVSEGGESAAAAARQAIQSFKAEAEPAS